MSSSSISLSSSDSDLSDLEILMMLSDYDDSDDDNMYSDHSSNTEESIQPFQIYIVRVNYTKTLDVSDFLVRFRIDKTQVENLLKEIHSNLENTCSTRNDGISPLHQLLLALRYYAIGSKVFEGELIGVSRESAGQIVSNVSIAITQLYSKYVYVNNTIVDFYKIAHFPRVLGVIDCTHIRIHNPCGDIPKEYLNLEGSHSINVQAVCDASLKFINIESKWPGSTHDATIFDSSVLKEQCETTSFGQRWLLGDNAYPLRPYLLTPIRNPQSLNEKLYNEAHKKTRACIEQSFKLWKRRFPALSLIQQTSLLNTNAIIIATAILHNICIINKVQDVAPEMNVPSEKEVRVPDAAELPKNRELIELLANFFNEKSSF